jgi:hypothetical protein
MPRYLRLVPPRHFLMKCLYQTRKVIGGQVFVYWGVDFVSFYEFWLDIGTVLTMWNFVLSFYTMPPVLTHNRLQTAGVVCLVITIIHVEIVLTTMSTLYCELWHYICSSWIFMIYLPPNVNQPCNNYITRQTLRLIQVNFCHPLQHSLSRVVVPATLHSISVNAHFTRFL